MITLLTGQPGNGKTSKIINEIKKDLAAGRTVYTVGIPKLKLPVIQLTRAQVLLWHEKSTKKESQEGAYIKTIASPSSKAFDVAAYHDAEVEPVYVLNNIAEGSKIYVDEAQKGFEPSGVKVPEHISYLSEHRHHGLDFVFISQYPFLIHQTVRALITVHWHIRSTWKGRKLHEWPEWQERPQSQSALTLSASQSYSIDPSTFKEYESASVHTVVKHRKPFAIYVVLASFVLLPIFGYYSVSRIYAKTQTNDKLTVTGKVKKNEPIIKYSNNGVAPSISNASDTQVAPVSYEKIEMVSPQYDWTKIAGCVESKNKCNCYGDEGNKLILPESVCKSGVENGWSGRNKPVASPAPVASVNGVSGLRPDGDLNFSNAVGMGSRASPIGASAS